MDGLPSSSYGGRDVSGYPTCDLSVHQSAGLFFSACFVSFAHTAEKKIWNAYQRPLFSGSYNYGYKIDLPPGTSGMTPQLSLSYDSFLARNKAGWVGVGWEVPTSYIQTNADGAFSPFLNGASHDLVYLTAGAVITRR